MKPPAICVMAILCLLAIGGLAHAADFSSAGAPDLSSARGLINAKNYQAALANLATYEPTQHADVYSLMGYAYRKSGDRAHAFEYYSKALAKDPDHRGALEYQGELFIEVGDLAKARLNLSHLQRLCPAGCEEVDDLEDAINKK